MTTHKKICEELLRLVKQGNDFLGKLQDKKGLPDVPAYEYQNWYSTALPVVQFLAPDRYPEFRGLYEPSNSRKQVNFGTYVISDFFRNISYVGATGDDARDRITYLFFNQFSILHSLSGRVSSALSNIKGLLDSDLRADELSTAEGLLKVNVRAAGALAGVILEGHLQKVAERHAVPLKKKKPTLSDLNDPLREAGVYDLVTWRKVQTYADIRNICSHKKAENPTLEQVKDLLNGVKWALSHVI